jgi:hypothetical protein
VPPTTITGSYPRPAWFTEGLGGRPFKVALGDSRVREQDLDAVACLIREQKLPEVRVPAADPTFTFGG